MPEKTLQVAVFGESNVGKSHYGAQLIGRLNAETGSMRMRGAAPDLAAFDDVVQSLSGGVPGARRAVGAATRISLRISYCVFRKWDGRWLYRALWRICDAWLLF